MNFQENVSLAAHSNYRIGGPARYFFAPQTSEEALAALREASASGLRVFILGGGTNILFDDGGFAGLVMKPEFRELVIEGDTVRVGSGVSVSDLVSATAERALSGWEWAGGLPGTVGGAIRGNAGAFGGETKDTIVSVVSVDTKTFEQKERSRKDCAFGYRASIFKSSGDHELIVSAVFRLIPGDAATVKSVAEKNIAYRRERHPIELPNIGSIFKNVPLENVPEDLRENFSAVVKQDPFPVVPVAYLLSELGLKGMAHGGAMVSPKHPNFIVNTGGATAADVRALMEVVRDTVRKKFRIELEPEVLEVG